MQGKKHGTLIIIGGGEDKGDNKVILEEIARRLGTGKLVVTTVASKEPSGLFEDYERVFRGLGVKHVFNLSIAERAEARAEATVKILDGADAVFFTGGDQLKITSQIGDTPIFQRIHEIYEQGGLIAGTSAGASVVCSTMLVSGEAERSATNGNFTQMAPGLGLVEGIIVDQHFAERGRMGRMLAAVAENPKVLGLGIDENTAVVLEAGHRMYVLGSGAVYVLDGSTVTRSNITEEAHETLSVYDVRLHVLSQGDWFNLNERRPSRMSAQTVRKRLGAKDNGLQKQK
jgi:cyanophycinase